MDNVVSASAAGDEYPTTRVLTADGVVSLIGCLMGNPYINAVYIGHPGWKAMGGRIGYSAATGIMVIVLSWFGVISLMTAVIPVVAISPILLYIGMLIGSQAFQESPHRHAPAIVVALVPSLAAWGKLQIDNSLGAVSSIHQVTPDMIASMKQVGIMYHGLSILGGGSILAGVILGAVDHLHHRPQLLEGLGLRRRGRRAHLLRPDARRRGRRLREPPGRHRLPGRRRRPLRLQPLRRRGGLCSHPRASTSRTYGGGSRPRSDSVLRPLPVQHSLADHEVGHRVRRRRRRARR